MFIHQPSRARTERDGRMGQVESGKLTVRILTEIRDAVRETNSRLNQTNERLDCLEQRQVETETRLATEVVAVATSVRELREVLLEDRNLRGQIADHERRIRALEQRP